MHFIFPLHAIGNVHECAMHKLHGRMCIMCSWHTCSELKAPSDYSRHAENHQKYWQRPHYAAINAKPHPPQYRVGGAEVGIWSLTISISPTWGKQVMSNPYPGDHLSTGCNWRKCPIAGFALTHWRTWKSRPIKSPAPGRKQCINCSTLPHLLPVLGGGLSARGLGIDYCSNWPTNLLHLL